MCVSADELEKAKRMLFETDSSRTRGQFSGPATDCELIRRRTGVHSWRFGATNDMPKTKLTHTAGETSTRFMDRVYAIVSEKGFEEAARFSHRLPEPDRTTALNNLLALARQEYTVFHEQWITGIIAGRIK